MSFLLLSLFFLLGRGVLSPAAFFLSDVFYRPVSHLLPPGPSDLLLISLMCPAHVFLVLFPVRCLLLAAVAVSASFLVGFVGSSVGVLFAVVVFVLVRLGPSMILFVPPVCPVRDLGFGLVLGPGLPAAVLVVGFV